MTELNAAVSFVAWIVALSLIVGAVVCLRDTVELYQEAPTDGIYKLPLTAGTVLALLAALAIFLA